MLNAEKRLFMAFLLLFLSVSGASAEGPQVVGGWVTEPIGNVANSAAYFTVENSGGEADRLVAASTALAAARAEIYTHAEENGVMTMRRVPHVDVPAGGRVRFEPHGLHVMLIGLKEKLKAGDRVTLTLTFRKAGAVTVELPVRRR